MLFVNCFTVEENLKWARQMGNASVGLPGILLEFSRLTNSLAGTYPSRLFIYPSQRLTSCWKNDVLLALFGFLQPLTTILCIALFVGCNFLNCILDSVSPANCLGFGSMSFRCMKLCIFLVLYMYLKGSGFVRMHKFESN